MGDTRRDRNHFAALYRKGPPPWETGRPERWVLRLLDEGVLAGDVLDAGCGTGKNAIAMAARGCRVTAVDFVARAVAAARERARDAGVPGRVRVVEADVLRWDPGGARFDAVLDSGLFHVFGDADRTRYVERLRGLLRPGGRLVLLCFSDREPGEGGPRRVTANELRAAFAEGWEIERLERTRFGGPSGAGDGPHAWLLVARRVPTGG